MIDDTRHSASWECRSRPVLCTITISGNQCESVRESIRSDSHHVLSFQSWAGVSFRVTLGTGFDILKTTSRSLFFTHVLSRPTRASKSALSVGVCQTIIFLSSSNRLAFGCHQNQCATSRPSVSVLIASRCPRASLLMKTFIAEVVKTWNEFSLKGRRAAS